MRFKDVMEYIMSDLYKYEGRISVKDFVKLFLSRESFRWQVAFRLCHGEGIVAIFGKWGLRLIGIMGRRIEISPTTLIGYGLYIGHSGPVIVNHSTKIGNNCVLSQFTTIGSNHNHAATIGDNVYIGPGVCIVEDVHIGNNVTIGAGSVVTKDIPDNATVAVGNKWEDRNESGFKR